MQAAFNPKGLLCCFTQANTPIQGSRTCKDKLEQKYHWQIEAYIEKV